MGILEDLLSALGPNEASAATKPYSADLERLRFQNEQTKMQLAQQREAQLQQLRNAQIAQMQAKAQPKPDPAALIQQVMGGRAPIGGQAPGGTQYSIEGDTSTPFDMGRANERVQAVLSALSQGQAPSSPLVPKMIQDSLSPLPQEGGTEKAPFWLKGFEGQVGFDPQRGAFTNVGIVPTERMRAERDAEVVRGGQDEIGVKRAMIAATLKKAGLTGPQLAEAVDAAAPMSGPSKKQADKDATYIRTHAPRFYNKETGEPAGLSSLGESFDPVEFRKQHMELNTQQLKDVNELPQAGALLDSYERLARELPLPKAGVASRLGGIANIKAMRLAGDPVIQDLDSINARITGLATAFGGDKRVSDAEMGLLRGAVITDTDTADGVERKLKNLSDFYNRRVKSSGLPWLRARGSQPPPTSPNPASTSIRMKSRSGKPIISTDGGKTWSYE